MSWIISGNIADSLYTTTNEQPSLDQRFAADKSLVDYVSGTPLVKHQLDMSGANASPGTYVDADGLIKTRLINLIRYSENLDPNSSDWVVTNYANSTSTTETLAPDGSTNVYRIEDVGDSSDHNRQSYQDTVNLKSSTEYTFSLYVKPDELKYCFLLMYTGSMGTNAASYDLTTMTSFTAAGSVTHDVIDAGNGWRRLIFRATTTSNGGSTRVEIRLSQDGVWNNRSYTTSGGNGLYVWGAQLEEGSTASDYIPTTTEPSAAPRFDHDPVTGESLGLLIEERRTNKIPYSGDISNNWWNKTGLVTPTLVSSVNNPLENKNTYRVRSVTNSNSHYLYKNQFTFLSGETDYTFSALAAPEGTGADSGKLQLRIFQILGNSGIVNFDLNTGQKNAQDGLSGTSDDGIGWEISGYGIEPYPNGWYRVWMTFRINGANNTCSIGIVSIDDINASDASGIYSYTGSGTGGYYVAGIQVEEGKFKTSIIQTSGSAMTREADIAEITGANFNSFYNQSEGTFFTHTGVRGVENSTANTPRTFLFNGSVNDGHWVEYRNTSNQISARTRTGGSPYYTNPNSYLSPVNHLNDKVAVSYSPTGGAAVMGNDISTASLEFTSTINALFIGGKGTGLNQLNGHIKRLVYYPYRLPDAILQEITS